MELEEYLSLIKACPDDNIDFTWTDSAGEKNPRLAVEFGVYDNFPIFLKCDFDKLVADLEKSGQFVTKERMIYRGSRSCLLDYVPGTIVITILDKLNEGRLSEILQNAKKKNEEENKRHHEKQHSYNITMMIHPYQKKRIISMSNGKALTAVIEELSGYFIREQISVCFPQSDGWRNWFSDSPDYSRIVYHDPEPATKA